MTARIRLSLRKPIVFGIVAALLFAWLVVVPAQPASSAVLQPFTPVFSAQTNGEIAITGNALLTCPETTACANVLAGRTTTQGNNNFNMQYLDADSDSSTFASSMATVSVPSGSRILYAALFWGAATTAGTGGSAPTSTAYNQIKFKTPGESSYSTITSDRTDRALTASTQDYSSYADVTDIVRDAGTGQYWAADAPMATGENRYGGWALVVVYSNPSLPLRDLNVFSGYAEVLNRDVVTTNISGFLTPADGAVNARIGSVTYEGDVQISGDYMSLNGTRLSDAQNSSSNFFAGRVTNKGANLTDRTPANPVQMAVDAKVVDAVGVIPNGATSANVTFGTSGDGYFPAALTTQIDLYAPTISGQKSVVNLSGNDPATVGDILEYTVAFSNSGQDPARQVVMSDAIPEGTTYVPGSLTIGSGANAGDKTDAAGDDQAEVSGSTVTARLGSGATSSTGGSLSRGESTSVTFRVVVDEDGAGTTIENTASLDFVAATLGTAFTYETNQVDTPVADLADVSLTKAGPDELSPGERVTWQLVALNDGPTAAEGVVITDTLPDELSDVDAPGCTVDGHTLTCEVGTLADGASETITVSALLDADSSATTLPNVATVSSTTPDPDLSNNTAATMAMLERRADVSLTKNVDNAEPHPGESVTWTLVATNDGPSTARDTLVSDTVPDGLTVTDVSGADCESTAHEVSCDLGTLEPGDEVEITLVTTLDPAWTSTDPLTNVASVQSSTPDEDTDNNTAEASITPTEPTADLQVTKQTLTDEVRAGYPVTYQLEVTNAGPSRATGVVVTDEIPAGLSNVAATGPGACEAADGTVTCDVGTLAVGGTATVTVTAQVSPDATGDLTNTATADSDVTDPDPDNNEASVTDTVQTSADVSLTKTAAPVPADAGDEVTYTLTAQNVGPATARNVIVVDEVPDPLLVMSATSDSGECTVDAGTVECAVGDIAVGDEVVVTVVTQIPADASAEDITNNASVSSDTEDPEPDNNDADYTLPVDTAADVAVEKTGPDSLTAGESGTWTVTVTNTGPSAAANVVISDPLPEGLTDVEVSVTGGATCRVDPSEITCTAPQLLPGGDPIVVTITATLAADYLGTEVVNTATATSDTVDPTDSNNVSTVRTITTQSADLSLAKSGPESVVAGESITWTLDVGNDGPSDAQQVTIDDTLPTTVSDVSASGDGWDCTVTGGALRCETDTLPAGESGTVTVTGTVVANVDADTVITNEASIGSATPDPDPENNAGSADTTAEVSADVAIEKSVTPETLVAGSSATYSLTVTNDGPSMARDVTVSDTLPDGMTIVSAQSAGECEQSGQQVVCVLGSIAPGSSSIVQIAVTVSLDAPEEVTNSASVASSSPDPDPSNNSDEITTPVTTVADVSVTKTAERDTVNAGEAVVYTLVAVNAGPSVAEDVVLTDTLPEELEFLSADGCELADGDLSCELGDLAPGEPVMVQVTLRVPADADTGSVENTVVATSPTTDPDLENNTGTATVEVTQSADVSVTKSAPPALVAGEEQTWQLVVANTGPSVARDVVVTDVVPEPLTAVEATTDLGECTIEGNEVTCELGDVPIGQSVVAITTSAPNDTEVDTITNTASVAAATDDPDTSNNTSEATSPVTRFAVDQIQPPAAGLPATGGDSTGLWIGLGVAGALLLGGAVLLILRRRHRSAG